MGIDLLAAPGESEIRDAENPGSGYFPTNSLIHSDSSLTGKEERRFLGVGREVDFDECISSFLGQHTCPWGYAELASKRFKDIIAEPDTGAPRGLDYQLRHFMPSVELDAKIGHNLSLDCEERKHRSTKASRRKLSKTIKAALAVSLRRPEHLIIWWATPLSTQIPKSSSKLHSIMTTTSATNGERQANEGTRRGPVTLSRLSSLVAPPGRRPVHLDRNAIDNVSLANAGESTSIPIFLILTSPSLPSYLAVLNRSSTTLAKRSCPPSLIFSHVLHPVATRMHRSTDVNKSANSNSAAYVVVTGSFKAVRPFNSLRALIETTEIVLSVQEHPNAIRKGKKSSSWPAQEYRGWTESARHASVAFQAMAASSTQK
ncbi:hypothetical protein BDV97DRAFT_395905 [Delphinella strobiligena]|nr:hypothetical protein BDV97DRAFT_395905 [Delphinella strobiligena]